jgi:hypothetical protein
MSIWKPAPPFKPGIGVYFPKTEIYQNIEEFLTTNEPSVRAYQGAKGRSKALLHASFVRREA